MTHWPLVNLLHELAFDPLPFELHSGRVDDVGALAVFHSLPPLPGVAVSVGVEVEAFALALAGTVIAVIVGPVLEHGFSDSVF